VGDAIYLINGKQQAVPMKPMEYAEEKEFQSLLEQFPELLAGEQIDRDSPRRWLHVAREIGVPDADAASARWQLDHLFVDQDAIPTLVEVKRQSDTRLRREVVGQVLDYAANANRFWSADYLAEQFRKTCQLRNADPDETLLTFLGPGGVEPVQFWGRVHQRLRDGDMRLMFVADEVPKELQRIVEFLNNQMTKTEVLAIEVKRYVGGGFSTHIPRLLGQTAEALDAKAGTRASSRRKWGDEAFFAVAAFTPPAVQEALRKLYALAKEDGFAFRWGTGSTVGSLNIVVPNVGNGSIVTAQTDGVLKLNFGWLPPATVDALGSFARSQLGFKPEPGWQKAWPELPPESWTPSVESLALFLRTLCPQK
jgi:hypothetical protein